MITLFNFWTSVILCFAVVTLSYRWKHRRYYWLLGKLPNASGSLPIIGLAYKFFNTDNKKLFNALQNSFKYGPSLRKVFFGPVGGVVVDDPDQVQKVLISKNCVDRPFYYKFVVAAKGLVGVKEKMWKVHRKILNPAFNTTILRSFLPSINRKTVICMKNIDKHVNGPEFDVEHLFSLLAFDNVLTSIADVDQNVQLDPNNELLEDFINAPYVYGVKCCKIWLQFKPLYRFTSVYQLEKKHIANGYMKKTNDLLANHEKVSKTSNHSQNPKSCINLLLQARGQLTPEETNDEICTLLMAGFETVAIVTSMLCLLVAMHPNVHQKILEELQSVFKTSDEEVTEENMRQLCYVDLVIKETLRLWSPVSVVSRQTTGEIELGGFTLPKETPLYIPIWKMHRDKKSWGEDADEFKPERFEPENFKKVNPNAFIPFLKGSRNCIGYKYAMNSMKVLVAHFFRNYKVSTSLKLSEIEFEFAIATRVAQGCMVKLEKINFNHDFIGNSRVIEKVSKIR